MKTTAARILRDCPLGAINHVVHLEAKALAIAVAAGQVDSHPDAVAYAMRLK